MLILLWLLVYVVLAVIFVIYYRRWQADFDATVDISEVRSLNSFLTKRVDDPELERRRRIGAVFGFGLIIFGIAGLVVPA